MGSRAAIRVNSRFVSRRRKVNNVKVEVVNVTATSLVVAGAVRIAVRTTLIRIIPVILVVANATLAMIASVIKGTNVSRRTSRVIVLEISMQTVGAMTTGVTTQIATEVVVAARAKIDMALIYHPARTAHPRRVAVAHTGDVASSGSSRRSSMGNRRLRALSSRSITPQSIMVAARKRGLPICEHRWLESHWSYFGTPMKLRMII